MLALVFPEKNPTEEKKKEMVGMVVEVAIRILWDNYSYDMNLVGNVVSREKVGQ